MAKKHGVDTMRTLAPMAIDIEQPWHSQRRINGNGYGKLKRALGMDGTQMSYEKSKRQQGLHTCFLYQDTKAISNQFHSFHAAMIGVTSVCATYYKH